MTPPPEAREAAVCANPKCPACGAALNKVSYPGGYLNEDQWDSIRAGDWYCDQCASVSGTGKVLRGLRYFWNSEVPQPAPAAPPPAAPPVWFCNKCGRGGSASTREEGEKQQALRSPKCGYLPAWDWPPQPRNCQQEPPYPGADTVVCSIRAPETTAHQPSTRCAVQEPHAITDCGEFAPVAAAPSGAREEYDREDMRKLGVWVQANLQHHAGKSWSEGIAAEFDALRARLAEVETERDRLAEQVCRCDEVVAAVRNFANRAEGRT